jgi:hypothetical protein
MIDGAAITLADPLWETSYPNVPVLRSGQSLAGYCLELDRANDLDPGFTFRVIRRSGTGPAHLAAPGKWLSAFLLDLGRLASFTARPRAELERHTARPLMRWLYPARAEAPLIGGHLLGQRTSFALCPRCIQSGDLPLASLFAFTAGCPRHGLHLQSACATHVRVGHGGLEPCATPITLFSGGDRFYACPRLECGASYTALPEVALGHDELMRVQKVTALINELLTRAATAEALAPGFGEPLRAKILPSDLPSGRATALAAALRAPRPSLPALVDALLVSGTSVDAWLVELGQAGKVTSGKTVDRQQQRLPLFPSPQRPKCPSCAGTSCYRNGRAATLDRSQEFICKHCGTRFTRQQVLFSFDLHPRYRAVLAGRNQRRLAIYRTAVAAALSSWPREARITRTAVFAQARIPRAISYTTRRAGLVELIDGVRQARGS